MKPDKALASSVPPEEQAKIDRQKLLMTEENAKQFQSFCETIFSEKGSDKQKAKKLENAWLYCLGIGPDIKAHPLKFVSAIKAIIARARAKGIKPKAFQKVRAMLDVKTRFKRR